MRISDVADGEAIELRLGIAEPGDSYEQKTLVPKAQNGSEVLFSALMASRRWLLKRCGRGERGAWMGGGMERFQWDITISINMGNSG
jgi:hypothetical protein